jgi:Uma2 family endonuclease
MAAQLLPLSLQEFHKRYDGAKPAYEYWYGEAVQKSMPTGLHGLVQFVIMTLLKNAGWNPASEVRLKVSPDAEPVPDVIAVRGKVKAHFPTAAPELCIEIMSPGDTLSRAFEKAKRYILWGSECVWIIDPEKRSAWSLPQGAAEPAGIASTGTLRIGETEISLPSLFDEVDANVELTDEQGMSGAEGKCVL